MESISSKITPIDPTGVTQYFPHLSSRSPLSNYLGNAVIESLEGYVLPLLRTTPQYIHNLHFKTKITTECYIECDIQKLQDVGGNKGKRLFAIIGNAGVV